ncbi:MAG: serine/threonine-protein kinase [Kofleriaceae bacterium]
MLEPGTVVAGKLRVERLLGQGGMGTVYVATHVGLDQQVAIKVLDPALANQPEVVQRFVREARASARLKSDHVCRVMDVGALEDGVPYIEMELLDGEDLGQLIERGAMATETAADYVLQACVAIAEAHALGIVHRDLKPANLFVTHRLDGTMLIKVLDFGIATAPSSQELKITKTTAVMGSPGYMSPEHLRSARDVDVRSDIWALGVILYEAATGTLPFVAQTITELAVKVVMDEPAPLVGVDPTYAAVVARCLQKDPAQRYQSVAEFAAELAPIAGDAAQASAFLVKKISGGTGSSSMPIVRPPTGPVKVPTGPGRTGPGYAGTALGPAGTPNLGLDTTLAGAAGASQTMPPPPKPRRGALLAVLGVVVVGGGAAAFALSQRGGDKHHAHAAHRDAGTQLAQATPDAAPVAAPESVDEDQLLLSLGAMDSDHNWKGIIRMANVATSNPAITQLVTKAKDQYKTEQTEALASYAKRHDCTSAKRVHDESIKVLPDATADFDQAARCTAAPAQAIDPAIAASAALDKGDIARALALAEQALAKDPKNSTALDVAARAVCSTGDVKQADKAKQYLAKLDPKDRVVAGQVCKEHGIVFAKPAAPPAKSGPIDEADIPNELGNAKNLMKAHSFPAAEALAIRILATEPNNGAALRVLGISGCRLGHEANVQRALSHVFRRGPIAREIHEACDRRGE